MFHQIDLAGLRKSPKFGYAADLDFFKGKRKLEFKPGLNILYGPNGCGKSTILKILADTMCATQGGLSVLTQNALSETVDIWGNGKDKIALEVAHDGQPVMFCDPRTTVGLSSGAFDDDFFEKGLVEVTERRKKSHGQASVARLGAVIGVLNGKLEPPTQVKRNFAKGAVNSLWGKGIDVVEARMQGQGAKGQFTILLDEPESNFSLRWQRNLWSMIADPLVAARLQVIVASHSLFALGIEHANYLDLVEGHRQETQSLLSEHFAALAAKKV